MKPSKLLLVVAIWVLGIIGIVGQALPAWFNFLYTAFCAVIVLVLSRKKNTDNSDEPM